LANEDAKFSTARTKTFRAGDLSQADERTISQIERFGCSIVSVKNDGDSTLSWSYTIGIFDTCGKPELITVGLHPEVAHTCLNEAAKLLRADVDVKRGRHADLIGNVGCEFRDVDPRWVEHLMDWANWYNGGSNYPVLQAVYPDLEDRFPNEEGFDTNFRQPLLQPDAAMGPIEDDFWASADPASSLFDWKFPNDPHASAFLSASVNKGIEPVTFVSHDADDGAWQFLGDSMSDSGSVLVCLHHPLDNDPSLKELADLPLGWYAERDAPGSPWVRKQHEREDNSPSAK
jgi:hypothetical protein